MDYATCSYPGMHAPLEVLRRHGRTTRTGPEDVRLAAPRFNWTHFGRLATLREVFVTGSELASKQQRLSKISFGCTQCNGEQLMTENDRLKTGGEVRVSITNREVIVTSEKHCKGGVDPERLLGDVREQLS